MAAPPIPPIRLGLTGTGLAVEKPNPPKPNDMRLLGTEGVLAGSSSERRVTQSSSDATTHTTVFRGIDNGYRAELPVPGAGPLRRPRGSTGLPGQRISSSASFAA